MIPMAQLRAVLRDIGHAYADGKRLFDVTFENVAGRRADQPPFFAWRTFTRRL